MIGKTSRFKLLLAFSILFGFMVALSAGETPAQQQIAIYPGDFTQFGGLSSAGDLTLGSSSPPPAPLARQDYEAIYLLAQTLLSDSRTFRRTNLQNIPQNQITVIDDVLKNYQSYLGGQLFYAFCGDYDLLAQTGDCPGEDSYHDRLKKAQGLFAILRLEPNGISLTKLGYDLEPEKDEQGQPILRPAAELGREGLLEATRELVSIHMIFGSEFQVDALDYRFGSGSLQADLILTQELCQLGATEVMGTGCAGEYEYDGGALRQFLLALDVLAETYNADIGWPRKVYLADDFTNRELELFGMASGRLIQVMDEMALRYRQAGQDDEALAVYQAGAREQYMQALALAQKAAERDQEFLDNGGWEMMTNLGRMRAQTQLIYDGYNAFGYTADYVPLHAYTELRDFTRNQLLRDATEDEQEARAAQREFDQNATLVRSELQNLRLTYDNRLLELCGATSDDYLTCNGGLMAQNFHNMKAASDRMGLALQRLDNIPARIRIEEERAGRVINLTLNSGDQMAALSYAIGLRNAYRVTEATVEAETDEWHAGVENRTTITVGSHMGIPPSFGVSVENSTSIFAGVSHSQSRTSSMTAVFDPAAEEIGYLTSLRDVQQAATEAQIIGANSAAAIRNLLLDQAELLIELDIAIDDYNRLAAEHNHLVEQYRNWLNLRVIAQENFLDSYLNNPAFRILRENLTVEASRSHAVAAQFAYLTAKALEYEFLTPVPFLGTIFKARTADEIDNFLNELDKWRTALGSPGARNRYPYTISLAQDVLGLTDENLDPDGVLSPAQLAQLRYEAFQAFLEQNTADNRVSFSFATSLLNDSIFSRNVWNNRIADVDSEGNPDGVTGTHGVAINLLTRQLGDAGTPEVRLTHSGQASYRDVRGDIVSYTPGNAVLVGYRLPDGFGGPSATIAVVSSVNDNDKGIANGGLVNRSVAASNWTLQIDLGSGPNRDLDVTKLEDIVILMDSTAIARPGLAAEAAQDAERLATEFEQARAASALDQP